MVNHFNFKRCFKPNASLRYCKTINNSDNEKNYPVCKTCHEFYSGESCREIVNCEKIIRTRVEPYIGCQKCKDPYVVNKASNVCH